MLFHLTQIAAGGKENAKQLVFGGVETVVGGGREFAGQLGAAVRAALPDDDQVLSADGTVGGGALQL